MKRQSKYICFILALLMILSFTACGNDKEGTAADKTGTTASDTTNETTAGSSEDSPFAKFKGVKLTYWHPFS